MLEDEVIIVQQFYTIYATSCREGSLSREEWDVVNKVKSLNHLNQEIESMLNRLQHCVRRKRIILD